MKGTVAQEIFSLRFCYGSSTVLSVGPDVDADAGLTLTDVTKKHFKK
jgi:hypothetical protein